LITLEFVRELRVSDASGAVRHISSASGLILREGRAFVVGDDLLSLGIFAVDSDTPGSLRRMLPGELPEEPLALKKAKPDLECLFEISLAEGSRSLLVALPSGSKKNRSRGALIDGEGVRELDFSDLIAGLEGRVVGLNIEGAIDSGETIALFHRGNSKGSENAIFEFERVRFLKEIESGRVGSNSLRKMTPLRLGEIDGIRLTFGDAAKDASGRVWFIASAEATDDAYLDGAYGGAVLGRLSPELDRVEECLRIASGAKPEGLAFDPNDPRAFYVVTDADDPQAVSGLFRGRLD